MYSGRSRYFHQPALQQLSSRQQPAWRAGFLPSGQYSRGDAGRHFAERAAGGAGKYGPQRITAQRFIFAGAARYRGGDLRDGFSFPCRRRSFARLLRLSVAACLDAFLWPGRLSCAGRAAEQSLACAFPPVAAVQAQSGSVRQVFPFAAGYRGQPARLG